VALRRYQQIPEQAKGIPLDGRATRRSPEICSRIALADARQRDHDATGNFPA